MCLVVVVVASFSDKNAQKKRRNFVVLFGICRGVKKANNCECTLRNCIVHLIVAGDEVLSDCDLPPAALGRVL